MKFDSSRVGVSTNLFHNPEDILESIKRLSQYFSVIEIELENDARQILQADHETYESRVSAIDQFRRAQDIYLSVHAPYIGASCDLAADDEQTRKVSCNLLRQAIKFCADIGAERLTYHPGYVSSLPLQHMKENLIRSINELISEASDRGVKLCLENSGAERPSYLVFSPEDHVELCKKTGTRLTVDLIHHASLFSEKGSVTDQFFEKLAVMMPWIENIHIADMKVPKHIHLPIGEGTLPVAKLLNFLGEQNYYGNAIIEETGSGFSAKDYVECAYKFRERYQDERSGEMAVLV